jgi:hypothetical protein
MRSLVYGDAAASPKGNEDVYKARMRRHNREVREYFRDRPDDLLTIDLAQGGGWEPICAFLGHAVPDQPFPHSNRIPYAFVPRLVRSLRWRWRLLRHKAGLAGPPAGLRRQDRQDPR